MKNKPKKIVQYIYIGSSLLAIFSLIGLGVVYSNIAFIIFGGCWLMFNYLFTVIVGIISSKKKQNNAEKNNMSL